MNRFMLLLNIVLNFISILVTLYAVLVDSMLADYFNFTIEKCHFPRKEISSEYFTTSFVISDVYSNIDQRTRFSATAM